MYFARSPGFGIIIAMVTLDDFKKIELRIAKIVSAELVAGSEKLLKLKVTLGTQKSISDTSETPLEKVEEVRQILAGIAKSYTPEDLVGREIVIIANLEPRKLMGEESQGMLLAATNEDGLPIMLAPEKPVPPGTLIR